ncbi:putative cytochrome b5 [Ilyonectria sp. MPI-CAGE-AT-0026]|nr:putative cytochrome b5 [Ilyonectria sp. MPI-CAGE-AT-0026]
MASATELTYKDVAKHTAKDDIYVVVHDKVYNLSTFIDEHPGGEEVMLDIAGADATEAFEDVGHSDEARDILPKLYVGDLKRLPGDEKPIIHHSDPTPEPSRGSGIPFYVLVIIGGIIASGAYQYLQAKQEKEIL